MVFKTKCKSKTIENSFLKKENRCEIQRIGKMGQRLSLCSYVCRAVHALSPLKTLSRHNSYFSHDALFSSYGLLAKHLGRTPKCSTSNASNSKNDLTGGESL